MITATAVGRLGKDAETRQAGQTNVTSMSIAVDTGRKGQDGKMISQWYSVDIWGQRGDTLKQYLTKGTRVAVTGTLEIQTFTNQQGQQQSKPVIKASDIELLGSPQGNGQQQQQQAAPPPPKPVARPPAQDLDAIFASEDSIPF